MGDEEQATLDGQFAEFARFMESKRDGKTITLWRSDYWMRQARLLEDRKLTMTETGLAWFKYSKSELNYEEWYDFLTDLCQSKGWDQEGVEITMTNCGTPGTSVVSIPQYRDFFDTYKSKSKMLF